MDCRRILLVKQHDHTPGPTSIFPRESVVSLGGGSDVGSPRVATER
jgi:hypothetical protein